MDKAKTLEELEKEQRLLKEASAELYELLKAYWKNPDRDSMTMFLAAIIGGIVDAWEKDPPRNGIVHQAVWPGIGAIEIQIRKMPDGKSVAQTLLEQQRRILDLEIQQRKHAELAAIVANCSEDPVHTTEMELVIHSLCLQRFGDAIPLVKGSYGKGLQEAWDRQQKKYADLLADANRMTLAIGAYVQHIHTLQRDLDKLQG